MRSNEERRAVQHDPRNAGHSDATRTRTSFGIIALLVIVLVLTAVFIVVSRG